MKEARDGAQSLRTPNDLLDHARDRLKELGSLAAYAKEIQDTKAVLGFNIDRVNRAFKDCPTVDREACASIAINGMKIQPSETFICVPRSTTMRPLGRLLGNFYLQKAIKMVEEGTGLIFRESDLQEICAHENLNFSNNAHSVFQDKPRFIIDCSNAIEGAEPLNGPHCKLQAQCEFGEIHHPTINKIISDLLAYCHVHNLKPRDMRFISCDVNNAFGKMKIHSESVRYTCVLVSEYPVKIVLVRYMCFFGKSEYPYGYNVITKCLRHKLKSIIHGTAEIYVDDAVAFSEKDHAEQDHRNMKDMHYDSIGIGALSEDKSKPPSLTGDYIGWTIDLVAETIRPTEKAIDKLLFVFYVVIDDRAKRWLLKHVQALVSLTIRYSAVMLGMSCFIQPFILMLRRNDQKDHVFRNVSSAARFAIHIWRAAILQPSFLAVPLSSMCIHDPNIYDYMTINDAANSLGVTIYKDNHLVCYTGYKLPFTATHSRYQNVKEFMGFILSLLMIARYEKAPRGTRVRMKSDSMSALTWVKANRTKSLYAQIAFVAYAWIIMVTGYIIPDAEHIAGSSDAMNPVDAISRDRIPIEFDPTKFVQTTNDILIDELFSFCKPVQDQANHDSITCMDQMLLLKTVVNLVRKILHE